MLAQDAVTGQLYETPDNQPYGIGYAEAPTTMYDGLGNPIGFAFLAPLVSALAPLAARAVPALAKYVAPLAQRVLPGIVRAAGGVTPQIAQQAVQAAGGLLPQVRQAFFAPVRSVPYTTAPTPSAAPVSPMVEDEYEQYG